MSSLDDESTCEVCGGGEIPSNKKVSTSCAQKVDHCKNDVGASDKVLGNSSAGIDAVSDSFDRVDMSDDDNDDKLFADPPPKEDCQDLLSTYAICSCSTRWQHVWSITNVSALLWKGYV